MHSLYFDIYIFCVVAPEEFFLFVHTVLSNTTNFLKQIYLPHRVRVDLEVMAMEGYSTLPRSPEEKPHYWMQFNVIHIIPLFLVGGVLIFLRGYSQPILSFISMIIRSRALGQMIREMRNWQSPSTTDYVFTLF